MQPTSLSRFMHIIKSSGESISIPTLKDYLQYMEENYLTFSLLNYASPISEQETIKKRYYMDNGLLNNFLYKGETKLLENLCAIHLLKKYSNTDEPQLFFYNRNVEVDFYVPQERMAIQASFDINDPETKEREVSALAVLNKAFPLQQALIITRDTEMQIERDGLNIEVIPIWKWLTR
jgi:predicted AAA+ superfamily ATPase